jgi:hypothetical protein
MKKPNSNKNPAKSSRISFIVTHGALLPTQEQLTMIAATLAEKIDDDPVELVNAAVRIWNSAGIGLNYFSIGLVTSVTGDYFHGGAIISRDKFINELLPLSSQGRTFEIGKIGKGFIRYLFCKKFGKEPSDNEFTDYYSQWNAGTSDDANYLALDFLRWYRKQTGKAHSHPKSKSAANKKVEKII